MSMKTTDLSPNISDVSDIIGEAGAVKLSGASGFCYQRTCTAKPETRRHHARSWPADGLALTEGHSEPAAGKRSAGRVATPAGHASNEK